MTCRADMSSIPNEQPFVSAHPLSSAGVDRTMHIQKPACSPRKGGFSDMQRTAHPTYFQSLGAIGRYLDQHGYESLVLCELGDGFVVRVVRGDNLPEAIPFPM